MNFFNFFYVHKNTVFVKKNWGYNRVPLITRKDPVITRKDLTKTYSKFGTLRSLLQI